jgi:hypothetical protein
MAKKNFDNNWRELFVIDNSFFRFISWDFDSSIVQLQIIKRHNFANFPRLNNDLFVCEREQSTYRGS